MFDVSSSNTQASAPKRVIFDVIRLRDGAPYWPMWPACYIFQNES